jgi:hypothetical protein
MRLPQFKRTRLAVPAIAGLAVALTLVSAVAVTSAAAGTRHDALKPVREATRVYHGVAAVERAGYSEFTDVNGVTCIDGTAEQGNMGIHYVNGDYVGDSVIDPLKPEAVLYEPTKDGLKLTAVEYIVLAQNWHDANPPSLFGQSFMLVTSPNRFGLPDFWMLHAWLWKDNPSGRFNPWNPDVKCPPQS